METLGRELRRSLEHTVRQARRVAELGARKVIEQLAVHHHEPWSSMTAEQRDLRIALRAHGRQLGDSRDERRGIQAIDHLTTECAYEHWHRMLFARFLAETNLLIEPQSGMDITLEDCHELARERNENWLELATRFAERMLPEIFRGSDPVLKIILPPETRSELENLLKGLPRDVFLADDSLGWVYQFWQADRKEAVNLSGDKIGADELSAVTQLFTEDYMVLFLLHNTLGAWWAGKVMESRSELAMSAETEDDLRAACRLDGIEWTYLRFVRDDNKLWRPAAGTFQSWPRAAKEISLLDPCMGSGHFLVFALPMLAAIRVAEERMSEAAAVDAVLRENLYGVELDLRCTQIAAFNLAHAAWKRTGFRPLPPLNLACSGLGLNSPRSSWLSLAGTDARLREGMDRLYDLFGNSPVLGSLINPRAFGGDLITAEFHDLQPLLRQALSREADIVKQELAVTACGIASAAEILGGQYTLVTTNVPYLSRNKQEKVLRDYCDEHYRKSRTDLATVFIERCVEQVGQGGTAALVVPRIWTTYTAYYEELRRHLLDSYQFEFLSTIGKNGFETISGEIVDVALVGITKCKAGGEHFVYLLDAGEETNPVEKSKVLGRGDPSRCSQQAFLRTPGATLIQQHEALMPMLAEYVECYEGLSRGDADRFDRYFWELPKIEVGRWELLINSSSCEDIFSGANVVFLWESGSGALAISDGARVQGTPAWNRPGIFVTRTHLRACVTLGRIHAQNGVALVPRDPAHLLPILAFCRSDEYSTAVMKLNQKLIKPTGAMDKVPFDLEKWKAVVRKQFPSGFPEAVSHDPTQWYFTGHPLRATQPLQVAVARLLGYRWPRQTGSEFPGCPAIPADDLGVHGAPDGIVCLQSIRNQPPAAERLIALLRDAFQSEWSAGKLASLLSEAGFAGATLDDWLRNGFFLQHCELFSQRPFVWHIWDGRRDGFHALVNCHKLCGGKGEGKRTLEKLIYTYLGDWIDFQRAEQRGGVEGADARVASSEALRQELENVLVGEPPYDLFIRWRRLAQQPVGWNPDVEDGVRRNIRPFVEGPLARGAKAGGVLRAKPRISWDNKADGKETQGSKSDFPWLYGWDRESEDWQGGRALTGERYNGCHYSSALKLKARGS